jgi:RNA polymerase sigma-70 factor, ECF subfamily
MTDFQDHAGLIARAQEGDEAAWEALYRLYEAELRARTRARLGRELRAQEESVDVLQSVWREAVGSLGRFEYRGEGSFLAWISTLLRHKIAARYARRTDAARGALGGEAQERALEAAPAVGPSPSECATAEELRGELLASLERLPQPMRQLLRWAYFEGAGPTELGKRLGIGSDAARMRLARAEARLAGEMGAARSQR